MGRKGGANHLDGTDRWQKVIFYNDKCVMSFIICSILRCPIYFPVQAADTKKFGPYEIKHGGTRYVRDAYNATVLNVLTCDI